MNKIINLQKILHKGFFFWGMTAVILFVSLLGIQNVNAAITSQLDFGSSGLDVVKLQTYLATNASIYPSGLITGYFGPLTKSAVQEFQIAQGIISSVTSDNTGYGRVGSETKARMNTLIDFTTKVLTQKGSASLIGSVIADPKKEQINLFAGQAGSGLPVRLKIPNINVDALIDPMGVTQDGAMEAPSGSRNVGWFIFGPRPGDIGSAVIDGHYGHWQDENVSVFDDLSKLNPGDKIYIEDEKEVTITFVVRESRVLNPDADTFDIFVSDDGKAHLNIITCEGIWDSTQKTYSNRLIIFTDKE